MEEKVKIGFWEIERLPGETEMSHNIDTSTAKNKAQQNWWAKVGERFPHSHPKW